MTHAEMRRMFRLAAVYVGFTLGILLFTALSGCNADCASPFDKPDETTQPVACDRASGCQS